MHARNWRDDASGLIQLRLDLTQPVASFDMLSVVQLESQRFAGERGAAQSYGAVRVIRSEVQFLAEKVQRHRDSLGRKGLFTVGQIRHLQSTS